MEPLNESLTMATLLISFFGALVLIVFILAKYTYLTKKVLAENNQTPSVGKKRNSYLDVGCIILGLGIGLFVSSVFTVLNLSEGTMELMIYGTIVIFGGIGLILAHYIRRRSEG